MSRQTYTSANKAILFLRIEIRRALLTSDMSVCCGPSLGRGLQALRGAPDPGCSQTVHCKQLCKTAGSWTKAAPATDSQHQRVGQSRYLALWLPNSKRKASLPRAADYLDTEPVQYSILPTCWRKFIYLVIYDTVP